MTLKIVMNALLNSFWLNSCTFLRFFLCPFSSSVPGVFGFSFFAVECAYAETPGSCILRIRNYIVPRPFSPFFLSLPAPKYRVRIRFGTNFGFVTTSSADCHWPEKTNRRPLFLTPTLFTPSSHCDFPLSRRQQAEEISCASHLPREDEPPDTGQSKMRNTTQDLFELLERVQSARIDDQRCVLPPYFSQVSLLRIPSGFFGLILFVGNANSRRRLRRRNGNGPKCRAPGTECGFYCLFSECHLRLFYELASDARRLWLGIAVDYWSVLAIARVVFTCRERGWRGFFASSNDIADKTRTSIGNRSCREERAALSFDWKTLQGSFAS